MFRTISLALALGLGVPGHALSGEWLLAQNDPNPFCPANMTTTIEFVVAQTAPIRIEVWESDLSEVVATLVDGVLAAGFHQVVWNGTDGGGQDVPSGSYPYRMTAGTDPVLFEETKVLDVSCEPSAVEGRSWGRVKSSYRE